MALRQSVVVALMADSRMNFRQIASSMSAAIRAGIPAA